MDEHTFLLIAVGVAAFLMGRQMGQKQGASIAAASSTDDPAKELDASMAWFLNYGKM